MDHNSGEKKLGLSLRNAYIPDNAEEKKKLIDSLACAACGSRTGPFQIDEGSALNLGYVVYHEVFKRCSCGFTNRFFVIINEILREQVRQAMPADDAIELAEKKELFEDPAVLEGIHDLELAWHAEDLDQAESIVKDLANRFPEHPHVFYNLGWLHGERSRWQEAIEAYDRALRFNPNFPDAWFNKSLMYARLGDYHEARLCMEKVQILTPRTSDSVFNRRVTLHEEDGLFGRIRVVEDNSGRSLMIGEQNQGGAYLSPDSRTFLADAIEGPGALPESFYLSGWLAAACEAPQGNGLILGLGSGAGAVTLLQHFPELTLEVVEQDPAIIRLAEMYFPLTSAYRKLGRLKIIEAEAGTFLAKNDRTYDFSLMDLYAGVDQFPPRFLKLDFIKNLCRSSQSVWANLIGNLKNPYLRMALQAFVTAGHPMRYLSSAVSPNSWDQIQANWLASTADVDRDKVRHLLPFPELPSSRELEIIRCNYKMLWLWTLTEPEINAFVRAGTIPKR